ncbi:hypothetical protein K432DRAFT_402749 [Lepidopterella palustris CBS 459.81]|uniref:Uncharacterized protein n=1 Tax=Lepidopterella palustris CBS 459.81 TaxID=1314670 RepID=A0A8E2EEK7_9PEZI|nr:hypothetical protein K432DRAFT_402749 [Lepidopterella palustris CBS 459.81]
MNLHWLLRIISGGINNLHAAVALLEAGYAVMLISKRLPRDLDPYYSSQQSSCNKIELAMSISKMKKPVNGTLNATSVGRKCALVTNTKTPVLVNAHVQATSPDARFLEAERAGKELPENTVSAFWYSNLVFDFLAILTPSLHLTTKSSSSLTSFCVNAPKLPPLPPTPHPHVRQPHCPRRASHRYDSG